MAAVRDRSKLLSFLTSAVAVTHAGFEQPGAVTADADRGQLDFTGDFVALSDSPLLIFRQWWVIKASSSEHVCLLLYFSLADESKNNSAKGIRKPPYLAVRGRRSVVTVIVKWSLVPLHVGRNSECSSAASERASSSDLTFATSITNPHEMHATSAAM